MSGPGERPAARKRGLGMGLSVLLGSGPESISHAHADESALRRVPIEHLRPSRVQPRRLFPRAELDALADSIRTQGIMQPLLVRPLADNDEGFEIVAGERRWRAAQLAGVHELPVLILDLSDRAALEVALVENVQRQDLSPLEEAEGYRRLIDDFGHTQDELARALGRSRSHIANLMRLLGLPERVRVLLEAGELSAGHARALLGARDPEALARAVIANGLNVRQTEDLVRAENERPLRARQTRDKDPDTRVLEQDLSRRLGLNVRLSQRSTGGTLTISYRSLDQLDALLRRLS